MFSLKNKNTTRKNCLRKNITSTKYLSNQTTQIFWPTFKLVLGGGHAPLIDNSEFL